MNRREFSLHLCGAALGATLAKMAVATAESFVSAGFSGAELGLLVAPLSCCCVRAWIRIWATKGEAFRRSFSESKLACWQLYNEYRIC